MKLLAFLVLCGMFYEFGVCNLAPFITPCREADTVCLKSSAQKLVPVLAAGVPTMGISTLDPMFMERVRTSQAGLDLDFRNTYVTGLKECKVLNLKRQKTRTFLDLKCSVTLKGDYNLGGRLLIMPIEGSGKYGIRLRDIVVKILFHVTENTHNGDKYWKVDSFKHSYNVESGANFQFKNLFNGNKELSDSIHKFANDNWRDITQEVAPPVVKEIVTKIVGEVTKIFDKVPIKELTIE